MSNNNYVVKISDDKFEFSDFTFDDAKVTGGELADVFGVHPVENYRVYQQVKNLELEELRPNEKIDISSPSDIYIIEGDASYNFTVDGLNLVWPRALRGGDIKKLIKKNSSDFDLFLEYKDEADQIVNDDRLIDITQPSVERFYTKKKPDLSFDIFVEGILHKWYKKEISYEEVVTLEVPDYATHPEITYSVKYKKGPGVKPEGILTKGAIINVKNGMEFNVSETGQS